ncbi:hypothetical protein TIFTF001_015605 [Ficus carica]|uniref:Uncharacterized protein n=1 Tax=Ficus carica TaxID=3494 RepID=A0AA88AI11_FICCA|nr:hypothetical protein TIFTF001_015605 [Ficus carica]
MFILKWLSDLPPFLLKVLARKSSMCYFLLVAGIGRQWNHSIGEILSGKPTRGIRPRDATAENSRRGYLFSSYTCVTYFGNGEFDQRLNMDRQSIIQQISSHFVPSSP